MRKKKMYQIVYGAGQSEASHYLEAKNKAEARELFGTELPIVRIRRCLPIRKRTVQQLIHSGRK